MYKGSKMPNNQHLSHNRHRSALEINGSDEKRDSTNMLYIESEHSSSRGGNNTERGRDFQRSPHSIDGLDDV